MEKKYELADDYIDCFGYRLHRIRALKDFRDVKAGDLGGYILSEDNLSHNGTAWIFDNAKVIDFAKVQEDAAVFGNALIRDYAIIRKEASVGNDAIVSERAIISDTALVFGPAIVSGIADVTDGAAITKNAVVKGPSDYSFVAGFGDHCEEFTFFRTSDGGVGVDCDFISGTLNEFREEIRLQCKEKELLMLADLMELHFGG